MPLIGEPDVYSALLKNIIHQQLNMKFAYTLTYRFVTKYGTKVENVWFYPQAEVVSKLNVEELRELQFSKRKAEYVIGIAQKIVSSDLDLEKLYTYTNQEVYEELLPVRGVGPWTVECVLLFGLRRKDILPAGDVGIQNAILKWYQLPTKPTKEEVMAYKENWSPYSSYISMYLWESLSG
nr:DNA-3-methyladenine glycosylase [Pseudalkalibacillus hwajinpoensis]